MCKMQGKTKVEYVYVSHCMAYNVYFCPVQNLCDDNDDDDGAWYNSFHDNLHLHLTRVQEQHERNNEDKTKEEITVKIK